MDSHLETETTKLANEIRDLLGNHILKLKNEDYKQALMSCLIALAIEVGRFRWLSVETEEVDPDAFDETFWAAVSKHFNANKQKYCSSAH